MNQAYQVRTSQHDMMKPFCVVYVLRKTRPVLSRHATEFDAQQVAAHLNEQHSVLADYRRSIEHA